MTNNVPHDLPLPKMLVAGGAASLVYGNFRRKLQEAGADVGWHMEGRGRTLTLESIPAGCAGVIVLKDMIGHALSESAKATAKANSVPCATVTRKWAEAEPLLRTKGIIPPLPPVAASAPSDESVVTLGTGYVCTQREQGRNPSQDEIDAILKRTFGPDFSTTEPQFKMITKAAIERVPIVIAPPAPVSPPLKATPPRSEVQLAASMMLGVSPIIEKGLDKTTDDDLAHLTRSVADFGGWDLTPDIEQICREVVTANFSTPEVVVDWLSLTRAERCKVLREWLVTTWQEVKAGARPYITERAIRPEAAAKFGMLTGNFWDLVREARTEVYGSWATHLDATVADYQDMAQGRTLLTFAEAKVVGLQCIQDGGIVRTSRQAIEEFLNGLAPVEVAAPPKVVTQSEDSIEMEKQIKDQFDAIKSQNDTLLANQANLERLVFALTQQVKLLGDRLTELSLPSSTEPKSTPTEGLLALVQAGYIRLVVEPVTK